VIAPPTPLLSFFVTARRGWRGRRGEVVTEVSYAAPQMAALGRTQIEARLLAFARRHREAAIGHQLPLYSAAMAASDHGHTFYRRWL
jgi:hypothetical protein